MSQFDGTKDCLALLLTEEVVQNIKEINRQNRAVGRTGRVVGAAQTRTLVLAKRLDGKEIILDGAEDRGEADQIRLEVEQLRSELNEAEEERDDFKNELESLKLTLECPRKDLQVTLKRALKMYPCWGRKNLIYLLQ